MTAKLTSADREKMKLLLSLVDEQSRPNINALSELVKNLPLAYLNIKTFGYDLARRLSEVTPLPSGDQEPGYLGLPCKTSIQADIESAWSAYWCRELQIPVTYHRKVWELVYVLQVLHEHGHRRAGARGLGFGCGVEPLPSYFASRGIEVTMTDMEPDRAQAAGWATTSQHTASLELAFHAHLVDRATFDDKVSLRYVDMNAIPADLQDYDFCWSVCALEHLGSIQKGLEFIRNSLKVLKVGGVSVHTTEFNINPNGPTIDNWGTVLFQRHHFEQLAAQLVAEGHRVAPLDFSLGDKPFDRFIDLPPFHHDLPDAITDWLGAPQHLKVAVDGFPATCFGFIAWRGV
ncbi:methyltransferase domain-containing protein [Sphingomonas sp.]|uniref:methyltransferase domain-containing protein n=1 Tax=Sphingomonas sp. TaxID=28214 RepID=UPI002FDB1D27